MEDLIRSRNLENLRKLQICFEGTAIEQEIRGAIAAIELELGREITPQAQKAGQPSKQTLYDEWQAACANQELPRLIELRDAVVQQGIVDGDVADAIIQSLTE